MSDEEKKAIKELKHYSIIGEYWKQTEYTNSEIDNYIKIILILIEKQSKEIEQLKEKNKEYEILLKKQEELEKEKENLIKQGWLNE